MPEPQFTIEQWPETHPRWPEVLEEMRQQNHDGCMSASLFEGRRRHLVALRDGEVVGFLGFVVWEIGPHDRGHPPVQLGGETLTEAKILAFAVRPSHRRRGIGRALQQRMLDLARELGCYQVRSVSSSSNAENHQLKLSMGFAVEPMERDEPCLAFVMPLR